VALRYVDLGLLILALPVFIISGLPMLGYAALAAAWLCQRGIQLGAERRTARALARGDRRGALGALAATMLGRLWLVTLAILLVGLAEREAGLAAAVLAAVLVTAYLIGTFLSRLFGQGAES
jgi:hypothetical protein